MWIPINLHFHPICVNRKICIRQNSPPSFQCWQFILIHAKTLIIRTTCTYWHALMIFELSRAMSSAFSLVKGLGMSNSSRSTLPEGEVTTKAPFRGFSGLISTLKPAAFTAFSMAAARVLNAPQDLQCSMVITPSRETSLLDVTDAFVFDGEAVFFAAVFALEVVFFFGAIPLTI